MLQYSFMSFLWPSLIVGSLFLHEHTTSTVCRRAFHSVDVAAVSIVSGWRWQAQNAVLLRGQWLAEIFTRRTSGDWRGQGPSNRLVAGESMAPSFSFLSQTYSCGGSILRSIESPKLQLLRDRLYRTSSCRVFVKWFKKARVAVLDMLRSMRISCTNITQITPGAVESFDDTIFNVQINFVMHLCKRKKVS